MAESDLEGSSDETCLLRAKGGHASVPRPFPIKAAAILFGLAVVMWISMAASKPTHGKELSEFVQLDASDAADCCLKWTSACYDAAGGHNKGHACTACGSRPCEDICSADSSSRACELCCTHYPDHETDWQCDAVAGLITPGEAVAKTMTENKTCRNPADWGCYQQGIHSNQQLSAEDCLDWCASWGLPGCCHVGYTIHETKGECDFVWGGTELEVHSASSKQYAAILTVPGSANDLSCAANKKMNARGSGGFVSKGPGTCCKRNSAVQDIAEPQYTTVYEQTTCKQCQSKCLSSADCKAYECTSSGVRCELHRVDITAFHCHPGLTDAQKQDFECHLKDF